MAKITINEISENYTYSVRTSSFATVALPITSSWGPGFFGDRISEGEMPKPIPESDDGKCVLYSNITWDRFESSRRGLEMFVGTYRGPSTDYIAALDYSYQIALTLISSGYDILVCRLCPGSNATGALKGYTYRGSKYAAVAAAKITVTAKYPGSWGNRLHVELKRPIGLNTKPGWYNLITYITDGSGVRTTLENLPISLILENSTESRIYYRELESKFISSIVPEGITDENISDLYFGIDSSDLTRLDGLALSGGTDTSTNDSQYSALAKSRYEGLSAQADSSGNFKWDTSCGYYNALTSISSPSKKQLATYREWLFTAAAGNSIVVYDAGGATDTVDTGIYALLKDKLNYNPNRIISPWDDQDIFWANDVIVPSETEYMNHGTIKDHVTTISPIHVRLMDVAFYSRCATAMLDIPRSLNRCDVYSEIESAPGYAQKLARNKILANLISESSSPGLYPTHSALFAPWGKYKYTGTARNHIAPPSFLALLIQYAQIHNQSEQYEWILPRNRKHSLNIGKLDYTVPKKLLEQWQKLEGVSINVITKLPELGTNIWGNSTLFEVPEATYQALANLSTRYLVNAVEDTAYRAGLSITFQYNNDQAYNQFYAGVTPLLDTMKNVGAIEDYRVQMAADINGLDQVNANSVIGQIILIVNGVINDITVDLVALPPSANIDDFAI